MRARCLLSGLLCGLLLPGCVSTPVRPKPNPQAPSPARIVQPPKPPPVLPVGVLTGQVIRVNRAGRFAILRFPVGVDPQMDQRLGVYRNGAQVGELKVSPWRRDDYVAADLVEGDCQVGDGVRDL
jgi:hypothetical protein